MGVNVGKTFGTSSVSSSVSPRERNAISRFVPMRFLMGGAGAQFRVVALKNISCLQVFSRILV